MFKRVERKRKRREEEEELGLNEDTKGIMGFNNTDSDETDSGSEHGSPQSDDPDTGVDEDRDQEEDVLSHSEDEGIDEVPPISVAEALRDPIYLISLDPTSHGCVVCKGKLIKNLAMAVVHKNASAHKRRFEYFGKLAAESDPQSSAWELVRSIHSASGTQKADSQELSKRALRRQVKQAAIREKRKRHRELKAKAITKKALKRPPTTDESKSVILSRVDSQRSPITQKQCGKSQKKPKLESRIPANTIMETRDMMAKSVPRRKTPAGSKNLVPKSRLKLRKRQKDIVA